MKKYALAFALIAGLTGCTSSERATVNEETRARTSEAASNLEAKRREYRAGIDRRLEKIDRQMEEERVKAETRRMNAKAKREYNEKMAGLREERAQLNARWERAKDVTADGWDKFTSEMDQAMDSVERGWNRMVADIKD
ncbi:MAG TPA: hypothetical protein VEQ63_15945 [Bryobacteraceae bacterium]|nr:hypothetical protein [Bryobacteraceae bacterium]